MRVLANIILFCILFSIPGLAQNGVLTIAQQMPEFPGGTDALAHYIGRNLQYPPLAREENHSGKAYVKFIVDTSGNIVSPQIIKSSGYTELNNEALRLVGAMPKWNPGIDSGKKVCVSVNIPITFKNLGELKNGPPNPKFTPEQQRNHDLAMEQWEEGNKLAHRFLFSQALDRFNKCLSIESNNKYALFDRGKVLMVLSEKDKACEIWNKMIQDNIRKDEAEEFIKKYCAGENGPAEMVKHYNKMKAIDFFDGGMKEANNGRYEAALRRFDSCLKYNPEHKDALFNKALMHFKLDQKNAACRSWNQLLALSPEDKQTEDLIKKHCN